MAGYIGALIAIGILLIGVSYIPIQLDRKGKIYLIGASSLIALATYASKITFAWWQSSLILILLAFLTALLLNRRLQQFVLVRDTATTVANEAVHNSGEDSEPASLSKDDVMEKDKNDSIIHSPVEEDSHSVDSKGNGIFLQSEISDVSSNAKGEIEEVDLDVVIDEPLVTEEPAASLEEELLAARSDWIEEEDEIEQVQEDSFADRTSVLEAIDEDDTVGQYDDSSIEESVAEWIAVEDVNEPLEEIDVENSPSKEEAIEDFDPLVDELSEIIDPLDTAELEGDELYQTRFEMVEHSEGELDAPFEEIPIEEESSKESVTPLKSVFQTQMLHALVEEVMVQEEILSSYDYEHYVKQFLQPSLPPQDYYTFASLLVQHHIQHQHYEKLNDWLPDLIEKFSGYPIIKEELQYIQDFTKEKIY